MIERIGSRWKGAATAVAVGGLAFTVATSGALAQEATPETGASATLEDEVAGGGAAQTAVLGATAFDKAQLTESIQQLTDAIALVQADRDAVASAIEVTEIDALLAKATELRDAASATLQTDDVSTAPQSIVTGLQSASAAQRLIEAGVSDYGLPSQQARTSRVLVQAYYAIDDASAASVTSTDANALFFTDTAKRLYASAYQLYNAGAYAGAERTAAVAQQVAMVGSPIFTISSGAFVSPNFTVVGEAGVDAGVKRDEHGKVIGGGRGDSGPGVEVEGRIESGELPAGVVIEIPGSEAGTAFAGGPATVELIPAEIGGFVVRPGAGAIGSPEFGSGVVFNLGGFGGSQTPLDVPAPHFD